MSISTKACSKCGKKKNISKSDSIPDLGIEIDKEWLDIYNNNYTM